MSNLKFAVGHDAEFFLSNNGGFVPAWQSGIGGTKENPIALPNSYVGTTIQEDGAAIELGMTPVSTHVFFEHASASFSDGVAVAREKGFMLNLGAEAEFEEELLLSNPAANILGCNPDNNAWERGAKRFTPDITAMGNTRFAAGHLHFSYPDTVKIPKWAIVQFFDAFGLMFWEGYSAVKSGGRYKFYGMPGIYREKPYGIEYRTPHNGWIGRDNSSRYMVEACSSIVQGCSALSSIAVREVYDSIDWNAVATLLDLSKYPTAKVRSTNPYYNQLIDIRYKLYPKGDLE